MGGARTVRREERPSFNCYRKPLSSTLTYLSWEEAKTLCLLGENQGRESVEMLIVSVEEEILSLFFQLRLLVAIVAIWVQTKTGSASATLCTACLQGKEGLGSRRPW